ncbi:methyltransferase domain-containing protein [Albimonas sp. CAU 1670]|uniref:methyltransferase domain-containing protein n=1 Tax=Albimonas sp. CAU 1670 TaxID=3032599 RepID=UPI0023DC50A5|nr:methyltransferase domain-containing protein [Albimonas sp. CAU 1670]MDF2234465.1 methyltransferase domain-containing protein [Albimonas sp. CAU 1670]
MNSGRNDAEAELDPRRDWPAFGGLTPWATPLGASSAAAMAGLGLRPARRVLLLEAGTGAGLAAIAAAGAGEGLEVWGAEGDPALAEQARALIAEAGLEAQVIAAPVAALPGQALPEFDLVLAPWGWDLLDEPARAAALALLGAKLAPGGGFLCAWSVLPGARASLGLRQLAGACWDAAPRGLSPEARRDWTVAALRRSFAASYRLVRELPRWAATLEAMAACPPALFVRMWVAPVAGLRGMRAFGAELRAAGLDRFAPARPERLARDLDMSRAQMAEVDASPDPWTGAELGDLMMWRVRRADLFAKPGGPAPDPGAVRLRGLAGPETAELRTEGLLGAATLSRAVYGPMLALLAERETATLAELAAVAARPLEATIPLAGALIGAGLAASAAYASPRAVPADARAACDRLTRALAARGQGRFAVSALLGGAVAAPAPGDAAAARIADLISS